MAALARSNPVPTGQSDAVRRICPNLTEEIEFILVCPVFILSKNVVRRIYDTHGFHWQGEFRV